MTTDQTGDVTPYRIEIRAGIPILIDRSGCRPATAPEIYFERQLRNQRTLYLQTIEKLTATRKAKEG